MTTVNTGEGTKERLVIALTKKQWEALPPSDGWRGVRKPSCSTCHGGTITLDRLSGLWGYSVQKIYSFINKGMPYHNGEYYGRTGRQGTNGITPRFVCLDEAGLWAGKKRNMFRRRLPCA